jgi:hypothetical protein
MNNIPLKGMVPQNSYHVWGQILQGEVFFLDILYLLNELYAA